MPRALAIFLAFAVGWIVYMIAMVMTVYDGLLSMIFQPIMAVICSAFAVGVALIVSLLFKIPALGRMWKATPIPAVILVAASLIVLCFGYRLGLRQTFTDPETNQQVASLRSEAALAGYFTLIFAIANWPSKRQPRAEPIAAPNGGPAAAVDSSNAPGGPPSVS